MIYLYNEGVEKVDNQIRVLPISSLDNGLRLRLYRARYGFPALEKYAMPVTKPIRIIVKNGNVARKGAVDCPASKDRANARTHTVLGVFSGTHNLVRATRHSSLVTSSCQEAA